MWKYVEKVWKYCTIKNSLSNQLLSETTYGNPTKMRNIVCHYQT